MFAKKSMNAPDNRSTRLVGKRAEYAEKSISGICECFVTGRARREN